MTQIDRAYTSAKRKHEAREYLNRVIQVGYVDLKQVLLSGLLPVFHSNMYASFEMSEHVGLG